MLGFEAALWVPSGVMGNEIAIRILTVPGEEVLVEERSHVVQYELAGMAVLSRGVPRTVAGGDGRPRPGGVRAAGEPRGFFPPQVRPPRGVETPNPPGGALSTG